VVDLTAVVQRARVVSWQAGFGILSGSMTRVTSDETYSVPQWDLHVSGSYENKNFLGGLRQLHLEDRPALIFTDNFPGVPAGGPRVGNVLSARFTQPGFVEARTKFIGTAAWDLGPDPFRGFFRNDIALKLGVERSFLNNLFTARVAVEHDIYAVMKPRSAPADVTSYKLPFLEQQLVIDARDRPERPRLGAYVALTTQEAFRLGGYGSWNYVRAMPDLRAYVPLFFDVVLAARFMLGALFVSSASPNLPADAALLGPEVYRLRGGGANGNRGFAPGELGDGIDGGTRRWESSLEARVPLSENVGVVLFGDVGDVHRETSFRFSHLNTALGFGLRYFSVLGALRFDAGWRVPGWQVVGEPQPALKVGVLPSAAHLTIGEAF
jgi:translocation and assembly module TamA